MEREGRGSEGEGRMEMEGGEGMQGGRGGGREGEERMEREGRGERRGGKDREGCSIHLCCSQICKRLGWKPPKEQTAFDVLPLVLQAHGGEAQWFTIPPEIVLETTISHPE